MTIVPLFVSLMIGCGSDPASGVPDAPGGMDDLKDTGLDEPTDTGDDDPDDPDDPSPPEHASIFVMEVSDTEPDWRDLAYLSAISASAQLNGGVPAVLAVGDQGSLTAPTQDLLDRLGARDAYVMGDGPAVSGAETTTGIAADGAEAWSLALAERFWESSDYAVVVADDDYPAAVLGASLAALLNAPLLILEVEVGGDRADITEKSNALGAAVVSVGMNAAPLEMGWTVLLGLDDTLAWLAAEGVEVPYLAVTNSNDRVSGRSQKASMVSAMYAATHKGLSVPVDIEMPTALVEDGGDHPVLPLLQDVYTQLGGPPEHLAIVGGHDALPMMRKPTIFDNPLDEQPVSDLPYGQADADPFIDIAIGRVVGHTVEELTASATRTAQYARLTDGVWERNYVEAGLWGFEELRSMTLNVGFEPPEHVSESDIAMAGSLEVGAFLHRDHSYCQILGHAVDINTTTLFAPAVVMSSGCSVGGIDMLRDDQRSIAEHMFAQGAVAFVGAARNAIAYNTIIQVSLWNQMLAGHTLGESFRHGVNDAIVHWLDDGSSAMRYAIDTEIVFGDPAFRMHVPGEYETEPAAQTFDGSTLTVTGPEEWTMVPYHPEMLAEWGYESELYMYTAPGAIPRVYWAGSYDNQDMYFGVQLHLDEAPVSIEELSEAPSPLGLGGGLHIDEHADGSASAMWRVRLLDFDENTGEIRAEQSEFVYAVD